MSGELLQYYLQPTSTWAETLDAIAPTAQQAQDWYGRPGNERAVREESAALLDQDYRYADRALFWLNLANSAISKSALVYQPYGGRTERHVLKGYRDRIADDLWPKLTHAQQEAINMSSSLNFIPQTLLNVRASIALENALGLAPEVSQMMQGAMNAFLDVYGRPQSMKLKDWDLFRQATDELAYGGSVADIYRIFYLDDTASAKKSTTIASFLPFEARFVTIPFLTSRIDMAANTYDLTVFDRELLVGNVLNSPQELMAHNIAVNAGIPVNIESTPTHLGVLHNGTPYAY